MQKTIFFDLDGTLTDSGPGIMNCARLALEHFGIPVDRQDRLRAFVGPPLREIFPKFGVPEDRVDEAVAVFRGRYIPVGKFENAPYPGVEELLRRLREDGFTLFVATSKPEVTAVEVLEHFGLAQYFDGICGASMERGRESKEAVIACLLSQTGSPDRVLMVGDTAYDVVGAKAHGIRTVGCTWGYGDREEMRRAGALAFADSPQALYEVISGIFSPEKEALNHGTL